MPELPEVETVVRLLDPRLRGRRIEGVRELFTGVWRQPAGTVGSWPQTVRSVRRRAKLILIELEGDQLVVVHLRMTGHLSIHARSVPLEKHTHVCLQLDHDEELRFRDQRRFGSVSLESAASLAASRFYSTLGPEPLEISATELAARLQVGRGSIKGALLDQRRIAGIGNIYADEILHAGRVHPAQPANTVLSAEFGPLHQHMQRILGSAIRGGGSTIRDYRNADGAEGTYQSRHLVFGRTGGPCTTCGTTIRKIRVAGRGTHFCPACQPKRRRHPRRKRRGPAPA